MCDCGKVVDNTIFLPVGWVVVLCAWEHNEVVAGWSSCLHELNVYYKKEVPYPYVDNEKRPDIVVFDSGAGSSTGLDITLSHPWNQEAMKGSATTDGYAANLREDRIRSKYQQERIHGSFNSTVFTSSFFNILEAGETAQ